jgi:hypothetical protein
MVPNMILTKETGAMDQPPFQFPTYHDAIHTVASVSFLVDQHAPVVCRQSQQAGPGKFFLFNIWSKISPFFQYHNKMVTRANSVQISSFFNGHSVTEMVTVGFTFTTIITLD